MHNGLSSAESFTKKTPSLCHIANMIENDILRVTHVSLRFFAQRFNMNNGYEMYINAKCTYLSRDFDTNEIFHKFDK